MHAAARVRVAVAHRRFALARRTGGQAIGEHAEDEPVLAMRTDDRTVEVVRRLRRAGQQWRWRMHRQLVLDAALLHRQVDDLLAVRSRTHDPVRGLEADQQTVAGASNVSLFGWRAFDRLVVWIEDGRFG